MNNTTNGFGLVYPGLSSGWVGGSIRNALACVMLSTPLKLGLVSISCVRHLLVLQTHLCRDTTSSSSSRPRRSSMALCPIVSKATPPCWCSHCKPLLRRFSDSTSTSRRNSNRRRHRDSDFPSSKVQDTPTCIEL